MDAKKENFSFDALLDHKVSVSILKQFNSLLTIVLLFLPACGFIFTLLWNTNEKISDMKEDISHIDSNLENLNTQIKTISFASTDEP